MFWSTLGKILWALVIFPTIWVLEHVVALLAIVLAPVLHILRVCLHIALIPFNFLAKFETVYIFFGTAILIGLVTGIIVYATAYIVGPVLGTQRSQDDPPRTAASYRAERAEKQAHKARFATSRLGGSTLKMEDSDWALPQNLGPPTAMMGTMILEEGSSSD